MAVLHQLRFSTDSVKYSGQRSPLERQVSTKTQEVVPFTTNPSTFCSSCLDSAKSLFYSSSIDESRNPWRTSSLLVCALFVNSIVPFETPTFQMNPWYSNRHVCIEGDIQVCVKMLLSLISWDLNQASTIPASVAFRPKERRYRVLPSPHKQV
jgi:hypothetical protein